VSAPTNVSPGTVTLNGTVDPLGGETTYWFEWGQNPTPTGITPYTRLPSATIPGTNSATPVSASLSGLVSGRTYYFRISAVNPAGTGTSTILGFVAP